MFAVIAVSSSANTTGTYHLAVKSIFSKVLEDTNPYNREDFVNRKYRELQSVYRLESDLLDRQGPQEILLIGVGRGYTALEMALKHPNITITAVNKEANLFNPGIITDHYKKTYSEEAVLEALSRINIKVMNIEEDTFSENENFDVIVFETKVVMYLWDKLNTLEKLFNERLKDKGALYFDGTYIAVNTRKSEPGMLKKSLFSVLGDEMSEKGHKMINFIRNAYVIDPTYKLIKNGKDEIAFPYEIDTISTEMESLHHRESKKLIVDPRFAPYVSVYRAVCRAVSYSA